MENMENFVGLIIVLALVGTIFGIVFGVIASFIKIGMQLAPIIVGAVLILLYYESGTTDFNIDGHLNTTTNIITDIMKNQNITIPGSE
jgi:hypothetical protein